MSIWRKNTGKKGEDLACKYLKSKGYKIISRNFRASSGEIDIIANEGGDLVFLEVKTRTSKEFGSPLEAVTLHKQKQIIKAAKYYLLKNDSFNEDVRFDVIGITLLNDLKPSFDLIKHAFAVS